MRLTKRQRREAGRIKWLALTNEFDSALRRRFEDEDRRFNEIIDRLKASEQRTRAIIADMETTK